MIPQPLRTLGAILCWEGALGVALLELAPPVVPVAMAALGVCVLGPGRAR